MGINLRKHEAFGKERRGNAEKLRKVYPPQPPRAAEAGGTGGHRRGESRGKVPLSLPGRRNGVRNEVRVNKCDEMLQRFAKKCVFLTVTCDFDMLFVVFFRKKGGEKGRKWSGMDEYTFI